MLRDGYQVEDILRCIKAVIDSKVSATAPWTSWTTVLEYPESTVFELLSKPFIYIESPALTRSIPQQGGIPGSEWEMILGAWDDRKTGGPEEINIIGSQILKLFRDPQTLHTATFTLALGGTTYTSKTLLYHGIQVIDIRGPQKMFTEEDKEFRIEFILTLMT